MAVAHNVKYTTDFGNIMNYHIDDLPILDESHNKEKFHLKIVPSKNSTTASTEVKMSDFKGPPENDDVSCKTFLQKQVLQESFGPTYDISDLPALDSSHIQVSSPKRASESVSFHVNKPLTFKKPAYSTPARKIPRSDTKKQMLVGNGVTIEISGYSGANSDKVCGIFKERKAQYDVGLRTSYIGKELACDKFIVLWYWSDKGSWMIGRDEHINTQFAYACAISEDKTPLSISNWNIFNPETKKYDKHKLNLANKSD